MGEHPDMTATTTGRPPHLVRARPARMSPTRPWTCPQPPEPPRRPPGRQGDAQRPPHAASPSASSHFAVLAVTNVVHGPSRAEHVPYAQPLSGHDDGPSQSREMSPWPSHTPNDVSTPWTRPPAHRTLAEQPVSRPTRTPRRSDVAPCAVPRHYSATRPATARAPSTR